MNGMIASACTALIVFLVGLFYKQRARAEELRTQSGIRNPPDPFSLHG